MGQEEGAVVEGMVVGARVVVEDWGKEVEVVEMVVGELVVEEHREGKEDKEDWQVEAKVGVQEVEERVGQQVGGEEEEEGAVQVGRKVVEQEAQKVEEGGKEEEQVEVAEVEVAGVEEVQGELSQVEGVRLWCWLPILY